MNDSLASLFIVILVLAVVSWAATLLIRERKGDLNINNLVNNKSDTVKDVEEDTNPGLPNNKIVRIPLFKLFLIIFTPLIFSALSHLFLFHTDSDFSFNASFLLLLWLPLFITTIYIEWALYQELNKLTFGMPFYVNTLLTVLVPSLIVILVFYLSIQFDSYYDYGPFEMEDLLLGWPCGALAIFFLGAVLHKKRENHHFFKLAADKILFYISVFFSILALCTYSYVLYIQTYVPEVKSNREGFLFASAFYTFSLPTMFWLIFFIWVSRREYFLGFSNKLKGKVALAETNRNRKDAIKKLREAKELLDLGILSQEEYEAISRIYKPLIFLNK
ncbi:MAG: SHOCT domain-containing protein [Bacteroidetes bacterium]|nr:SHOCT domain-containing protein [Bacteroidota bacterium]